MDTAPSFPEIERTRPPAPTGRSPWALVLALACALWPAAAAADEIRGRVIDAITEEPIAGAEITLRGGGGEDIAELAAAEDGSFAATGLGEIEAITLVATAPGYAPASIAADPGDDELEIRLTTGAGEVIEVVGRAPRRREAPSEIELEREQLETLPGAGGDALGALDSLPGVSPPTSSVGGGPPIIRGAAEDDSVILVDGVPIPIAYHFFALRSIMPTGMIDRIDYIPGGFGVSEGRATGGLIQISSRSTREKGALEGFAEMSLLDAGAFVGGPILEGEDLSFAAAFRRSIVDAVAPLAFRDDGAASLTTAPQYYDGQLRVDWSPDPDHELSLFALGSVDRVSVLSEADNFQNPGITGEFRNATDFSRAIATWRYRAGDVESTTTAWGGTTSLDIDLGDAVGADLSSWAAGARHDTRWRLHRLVDLELGGDFVRQRQTIDLNVPTTLQAGGVSILEGPPLERTFEITKPMAAGYAAAEVSPAAGFTLTPGVRLDYFGNLGELALQPRIQASLRLGSRWTLRGAAGEYARDLRRADAVADQLGPERSRQVVIGADYEISDALTLTGSTYYTALRDLAVADEAELGQDPVGAWESSGRGRAYGFETLLSAEGDSFYGWLSYTYARTLRRDEPGAEERRFEFDRPHNLLAVGSYERGPWRFGGQFRLASGQLTTPVESAVYVADRHAYDPLFADENSERFPLAHQLDLRVDRVWTFDAWELSAFLDVTNVYARPEVIGYQYSYDFTEREEITDLPILPAIGVRGSF